MPKHSFMFKPCIISLRIQPLGGVYRENIRVVEEVVSRRLEE